MGGGNDKLKGLEGEIYQMCLGNEIWINLVGIVRSYERKLGLAW